MSKRLCKPIYVLVRSSSENAFWLSFDDHRTPARTSDGVSILPCFSALFSSFGRRQTSWFPQPAAVARRYLLWEFLMPRGEYLALVTLMNSLILRCSELSPLPTRPRRVSDKQGVTSSVYFFRQCPPERYNVQI